LKRVVSFLLVVAIASCIDPYKPHIDNYKSLLVVEGLVTDENSSYKIKLSRTTSGGDSDPEKVTDANVYIADGDGIRTHLQNCADGYYKTDSTSFTGVIGQKYTLQILTSDGKEYESEECTMLPVAGIDSLYYEKGEEALGKLNEIFTGIKIFLNSSGSGMNKFFRWTFEETWKTIMTGAPRFTYAKISDTIFTFRTVTVGNGICWKQNRSGDIIINSILSGGTNYLNSQPIQFIAPQKSDRLTQQYSILVKQYSISGGEYEFWTNLKNVGEAGGDIFASQPYTVTSNVHIKNKINEKVLGYFEVSAVRQRRLYITASELDPLYLRHYIPECRNIVICPDDYQYPKPTWDGLYHMWMDTGKYIFVMPIVKDGTVLEGQVFKSQMVKFVFSTKVCSLCEYSGSVTKPDFWVDQ
jgi:hypothetical protein